MKYSPEEFKSRLLQALIDSGYYSERWGQEGGKDAREDKGYFNGRADAFLEIYGVEDFENSKEARDAYNEGRYRYNSGEDDLDLDDELDS